MTTKALEIGNYYSIKELSEIINRIRGDYSLCFAYVKKTSNKNPRIRQLGAREDFSIEERFPEEGFSFLEVELRRDEGLRKKETGAVEGNGGFSYLWLSFLYERAKYRMVTRVESVKDYNYIKRERRVNLSIPFTSI